MVKSNDGDVEIYGKRMNVKANLYVMFLSLFRDETFKKNEINELVDEAYIRYITKYKIEEEKDKI